MTGYGEAERESEQGRLRVEIKTVNHRFFNLSVRTPPGFERFDHAMRAWLSPFVSRGHAQVVISLERRSAQAGELEDVPELDVARARAYGELLRRLRDEARLDGPVDVASVLRYGDVLRAPSPEGAVEPDEEVVRELTEEAARALVGVREAEGARLRTDMEERLEELARHLDRVTARAPERLARERDRLRGAIRELSELEEVDEERLAREIAYLAEKWDINEELVRFRSHVELFRETLEGDGSEAAGKRLGFVVQEMHREVNTIGAKANDPDIVRSSMAMKEEIERLREQLENVE